LFKVSLELRIRLFGG
jgi:hypothetical protein